MKINLTVFWEHYDWQDNGEYFVVSTEAAEYYTNSDSVVLAVVDVEIPGIFPPGRESAVDHKVAALKAEKNQLRADTQAALNRIDNKIMQLSCLEVLP